MTLSDQRFGLYLVVTDPVTSYEAVTEAAVKAGLRYVQLRMKSADRAQIVATARRMRQLTYGTETRFIVNDDPSIAVEVEADGVHLGQGDMPIPEARRRYPQLRVFGLSTHSWKRQRRFCRTMRVWDRSMPPRRKLSRIRCSESRKPGGLCGIRHGRRLRSGGLMKRACPM